VEGASGLCKPVKLQDGVYFIKLSDDTDYEFIAAVNGVVPFRIKKQREMNPQEKFTVKQVVAIEGRVVNEDPNWSKIPIASGTVVKLNDRGVVTRLVVDEHGKYAKVKLDKGVAYKVVLPPEYGLKRTSQSIQANESSDDFDLSIQFKKVPVEYKFCAEATDRANGNGTDLELSGLNTTENLTIEGGITTTYNGDKIECENMVYVVGRDKHSFITSLPPNWTYDFNIDTIKLDAQSKFKGLFGIRPELKVLDKRITFKDIKGTEIRRSGKIVPNPQEVTYKGYTQRFSNRFVTAPRMLIEVEDKKAEVKKPGDKKKRKKITVPKQLGDANKNWKKAEKLVKDGRFSEALTLFEQIPLMGLRLEYKPYTVQYLIQMQSRQELTDNEKSKIPRLLDKFRDK